MKILLSINPEHVKNIINSTKKFEYRTKKPKKNISTIIIYETSPFKKVIGEAEIISIIETSPNELWNKTKEFSGITKKFYDEYFENRQVAYAYQLGEIKIYDKPKDLIDFGVKCPPQSFVYIN